MPSRVKEIKPIEGTPGRESHRKQIVKALAEGGVPIPLHKLPGWLRDIKELENQGLIYIDDMKMTAPKRANLTEKGKSYVLYEKTESGETL